MKIILFAYSLLLLSTPTDLVTRDGYKIGDVATCQLFRENESKGELILDNNDLERERGITILSKNVCSASISL